MDGGEKENIADGLLADLKSSTPVLKSPLPARKSGRSKATSLGEAHTIHGLTVPLKEELGNRRKSATVPAVRSILSGQEDENEAKKRKEARRKSLANRRVSFAPEATLHTWDVIEYLRDGNTTTSSSSSSSNALNSSVRRSPSESPQSASHRYTNTSHDPKDPPSTPPEHVDSPQPSESPANQRDMHQKKRRRRSSSGIPPLNFNNPAADYSSSPISGSSSPVIPSPGGESITSDEDSGMGSDEEQTGTAMSLDIDEATAQSLASDGTSSSSTGSSARLDEALRQAAKQAGTRGIEYDESEEMSMEMVRDEVTNAFKPWTQQATSSKSVQNAGLDKENVNPFSRAQNATAPSWHAQDPRPHLNSTTDEGDMSMDMSMDITRAVGGIVPFSGSERNASSDQHASSDTMDLTMVMPGSGILGATAMDPYNRRGSLKRRRSSAVTATATDETGSPAKKSAIGRRPSVRASRRRSSVAPVEEDGCADETMDLIATLGMIQEAPDQQLFQKQAGRLQQPQGEETKPRDSVDTNETSFGEVPMDMTMMLGGVLSSNIDGSDAADGNEDLSMEFTTAIGKIQQTSKLPDITVPKAAIEPQMPSWSFPAQTTPSIQHSPTEKENEHKAVTGVESTPQKSTPQKSTPQKSARKTLRRKSVMPSTPEVQVPATPQGQSARRTPTSRKKVSTPGSTRQKVNREIELSRPPPIPTTPAMVSPVRVADVPQSPTGLLRASSSPRLSPSQSIPPAVRSPLAPKGDGSVNRQPEPTQPKLSESIKQLATPRKQISDSPLKYAVAASTPRVAKSPKKSSSPTKSKMLRKSVNPEKIVRVVAESKPSVSESQEADTTTDELPRISLQAFLNMTGIQFMDLTTTKRRHTGFPSISKAALIRDEDDSACGDGLDNLERCVTAATTLLPELSMYQHSCHEMKSYLSTGKQVVRSIEADVLEEQPHLFREYAAAPPKERSVMDDQLKAMKTNARLESKGTWYQWRSQLLKDLAGGLEETEVGMKDDATVLQGHEDEVEQSLNRVRDQKQRLDNEAIILRRRKEERENGERENLDIARKSLLGVDAEMLGKRRLLEQLSKELQEKEEGVEDAKERKDEFAAAIKEAERVKEECRGRSYDEVASLSAHAKQLELTHHWRILSAASSPSTLTLAYRNELELFFHPLSFQDARSPISTPSKAAHSNAPISLTYNPRTHPNSDSIEPSTIQRFFLQLLRAYLLGLPQSSTPISMLLKLVSRGWEKCRTLTEAVRQLDVLGMTDVNITGDEQIQIVSSVLLAQVDTKVRITFDVGVEVKMAAQSGVEAEAKSTVKVKVVYGEKYDELKMSEFLKSFGGEKVGNFEDAGAWADAVDDLRRRLIKRGRKD